MPFTADFCCFVMECIDENLFREMPGALHEKNNIDRQTMFVTVE